MAKYRIVRRDSEPIKYAGGSFYWKELKKSQVRDLDMEEIWELNQLPDQKDDSILPAWLNRAFSGLFITVFMVAVVIFLVSSGLPSLRNIPDIGFLARSGQLAKDEALVSLRRSVVSISGASSSGSGFNISEDGLIVSNRHVVENNRGVMVTFSDGRRFPASNWQYVEGYDLAVASIAGSGLPYVQLDMTLPEPGDPLIFIGNPLGFDWTISEAEMIELWQNRHNEDTIIYFSGPVRSGSSGSPLFNSQGQVIGVIYASLRGEADSGLAIPAQMLLSYIE